MIKPRVPKYQWVRRVKAAVKLANDGWFEDAPPADGPWLGAGSIGEIIRAETCSQAIVPICCVEFSQRWSPFVPKKRAHCLEEGRSQ
ncbi:nitrogen fixation protein NifZ [Bradyrhizobium genosp. P]|uniref:nitrogen fixation protein NifZ n=1 Tax=Bradyrhizobium genosp. P TaxID=83641 RepID=UPI003CF76121